MVEQVGRFVDEPVLVEFLKEVDAHFYKGKKASGRLDFILKIGKIKSLPRERWILRGVKNPDTVASHAFFAALSVWFLGGQGKFSQERALKSALFFKLSQLYAGDSITDSWEFDFAQPEKAAAKTWPRSLRREKEKRFNQSFCRESAALKRVSRSLPADMSKEIASLWEQSKRQTTFAGSFTNQVYWLATYMQALLYFRKDKHFPILGLYEQMRQYIYEPKLVDFLKIIDKKFLPESVRKMA